MAYNTFYQPSRDASLGLIFRLNALWEKADRRALSGNHDDWELVLDRIFSNLLYRGDIEIEENGDGEIEEISLSDEDMGIWKKIKEKIRQAKIRRFEALRKRDLKNLKIAQTTHYEAIMFYDIWLRKFMQSLGGLYLRETESNPSKALFGGAFSK